MRLSNEIRKEDILNKLNEYEKMKSLNAKKLEEKVFELSSIIEEKNCKFTLSDLKKYDKFCVFGDYELKNTFIKNFIDGITSGKDKSKFDVVLIDSFLDEFQNMKEQLASKVNLVYEEDAIENLVEIYASRINESDEQTENFIAKKDIIVIVGDLSRMEKRESILYLMNNLQNDSMMPKVYFVVCSSSMYEIESYADSKTLPLVDLFNLNSFVVPSQKNDISNKIAI